MLTEISNWGLLETFLAMGVVAVGATVQASVGFGFALIAAPILLLLDPRFVPGPVLAASVVLTLLVVHREREAIDWSGVRFGVLGRTLGTPPAIWAVAGISTRIFDLLFAVLVAAAVALTVAGARVQPRPISITLAGFLSGFMGTASSIGGPPLALVYQHDDAKRFRGTLAGIFIIGTILSIVGLRVIGKFGSQELLLSSVLVPGVIAGFGMSHLFEPWVVRRGLRPAVLTISLIAAVGVLWRGLVAG